MPNDLPRFRPATVEIAIIPGSQAGKLTFHPPASRLAVSNKTGAGVMLRFNSPDPATNKRHDYRVRVNNHLPLPGNLLTGDKYGTVWVWISSAGADASKLVIRGL